MTFLISPEASTQHHALSHKSSEATQSFKHTSQSQSRKTKHYRVATAWPKITRLQDSLARNLAYQRAFYTTLVYSSIQKDHPCNELTAGYKVYCDVGHSRHPFRNCLVSLLVKSRVAGLNGYLTFNSLVDLHALVHQPLVVVRTCIHTLRAKMCAQCPCMTLWRAPAPVGPSTR